jgi:hypothetical protein
MGCYISAQKNLVKTTRLAIQGLVMGYMLVTHQGLEP